ncbi:MAG: hypothetical protein ACI8QC_003488 [Planctomycetota bacterium]|jgi:hypothetical protein
MPGKPSKSSLTKFAPTAPLRGWRPRTGRSPPRRRTASFIAAPPHRRRSNKRMQTNGRRRVSIRSKLPGGAQKGLYLFTATANFSQTFPSSSHPKAGSVFPSASVSCSSELEPNLATRIERGRGV